MFHIRACQFRLVFHSSFEKFCLKLYLFDLPLLYYLSLFYSKSSQPLSFSTVISASASFLSKSSIHAVILGTSTSACVFPSLTATRILFMLSVIDFTVVICLSTASWRFVFIILYVCSIHSNPYLLEFISRLSLPYSDQNIAKIPISEVPRIGNRFLDSLR